MPRFASACRSGLPVVSGLVAVARSDCALPAGLVAAWVTAAAWPASPLALVTCGAALKGVNLEAAADEPA